MNRRACIIEVANDLLEIVKRRLPLDVTVVSAVKCFKYAKTALKLAGPGLPEECKEPLGGGPIVKAHGGIPFTGALILVPDVPLSPAPEAWSPPHYGKYLN